MSDQSNQDKKSVHFSVPLKSLEEWGVLFKKTEKISRNLIDHYVEEKDDKLITDMVFPFLCEYYTAAKQGDALVEAITEDEDRLSKTKKGHITVQVEEMQMLQSCFAVLLLHKQSLCNTFNVSTEIH
jgi:hypothetical protein